MLGRLGRKYGNEFKSEHEARIDHTARSRSGNGSIHTEFAAAFAGILPVGRLFAFVEKNGIMSGFT
jgi:hypothetical protein